jgi:hypothetical protein
LRFTWSMKTTSSLPPEDIMKWERHHGEGETKQRV